MAGVVVADDEMVYVAASQARPLIATVVSSWPLTQPVYESVVTVGLGSP